MLYGATIILGLFAAEFAYEFTSTIAAEAVISIFENYTSYAYEVQPSADGVASQTPSERIAALELAE